MSLKVKLISVVSVFILVLSMLLVGVLAATGSFTINLKGNVQFNIDDSTLYIKDIRLSDGQTEGETIDNFLPGFVWESFELDFGTVSSDSGTISIEIDVINTTATTYNASSQSSLSNATLSVSGTIAGDSVPLDQVATYDGISGTIYISVQVTSSTSINLDNIIIDIAELQDFNVTFTNSSSATAYVKMDNGEVQAVGNGEVVYLNGSKFYLALEENSLNTTQAISYNSLNKIELYAPTPTTYDYLIVLNGVGSGVCYSNGAWRATVIDVEVPSYDENWELNGDILTRNLINDCTIELQNGNI